MLKQVIKGYTHCPGAPDGWDPRLHGECGALPVRVVVGVQGEVDYCESAWEPTAAELAALQEGGSVVLRVHGWQPPVALYVIPREEGGDDRPGPAPIVQRTTSG